METCRPRNSIINGPLLPSDMPKGIFYLIVLLLTLGLTAIGPWWFASLIPFLLSLYARFSPWRGFWVGFLINTGIWTLLILSRDAENGGILAGKIAGIWGMSKPAFLSFNLLVGGLLGGVGGIAGAAIAFAFLSPRRKEASDS